VTSATVEALPLDARWDGTVTSNPPDVYVDVKDADGASLLEAGNSFYRTETVEDDTAGALPLTLTLVPLAGPTAGPIGLDDRLRISVSDRDAGGFDGDDLMFAPDTLTLASVLRADEAPGDTRTLTFDDGATRLLLRLRWE
jgi:hypothetical protein